MGESLFENMGKTDTYSNCRSCVSLISTKEVLASYEEFRSYLSNNIVKNSWNEDFNSIFTTFLDISNIYNYIVSV